MAGNGAADGQHVVFYINVDDPQALDGLARIAHLSGHLLAFKNP